MKALLVVDIQAGLLKKNDVFEEELFLQTVNEKIKTFQKNKELIVYIQHNNKNLIYGKSDWEIDKRILKKDDDIVIQKFHGNAFMDTDLRKILDANNIDEITVCGLVTHACVRATCLGCVKEGYKTKLLKDGHSNWQSDPEQTIKDVEAELWGVGVTVES